MRKILLIDDEAMVLRMIEDVLLKFGYTVDIARNGQEGLRKFNETAYDLVITDILMPDIDGNSIARHIRTSERERTPIIGISGTPWKFGTQDFNCVLAKPFPIKTLVDNISALTIP